jgi:trigger factor
MNVTQTNAEGLKREYKITVPAGHISALVESRLEEVGRTVRLPGFRPGKIPMALLRKRYGQSVMGEVIERAVDEGARKALDENAVRPAQQPKVEITSYNEGGDLEFTVAVETLPDIEPIDFKAISIEKLVATIEDAAVDKAMMQIAENRPSSQTVTADRGAQSGDIALIDFLGKVDGVAFEGGKAEDYELTLGSGSFIPGFEDQLIGAKAGQDVLVKVTFPAEYGNSDLAGKDATFDVKVKELREKGVTAVDEDLAKALGLESLEALKTAVREELGREYANASRLKAKRQLLDALSDQAKFTVPQGMVDSEFEAIWKQIEQAKTNGTLDESDKAKSDEELQAEYRAIGERRVRLGLLLSDIGQKNNIQVTQDDLNRAMMNEARRFPGQEHLVFQYYQKNQDAMNALRAPIYEDKVVDFILELASVTEKTVSAEALLGEVEDGSAEEGKPAEGEAKPKRASKKKAEASE